MRHESTQRTGLPSVTTADHFQGRANAPVTLLVYGDYECPYTRRANNNIRELQAQLGSQLRYVYRHFPLTTIHPYAQQAAEAAEAAAVEGKFWDMHNILFEHQDALDVDHLVEYAQELQLDAPAFERAIAQHQYADRVERDVASGEQTNVRGTPTLFINGVRYAGSYDREPLQAALAAAATSTT